MSIIDAIQILLRTLRIKIIYKFHHIVIQPGFYNISLSTRIYGRNGGSIYLGKKVSSSRNVVIVANGGSLVIGDGSSFSANCALVAHDTILIGEKCMFGPGVKIYDHDHLFDEFGSKQNEYKSTPITIGQKCWIGTNVIILRGTCIGDGCIIGAGTVVKGMVPPHSIVTNDRTLKIKTIRCT